MSLITQKISDVFTDVRAHWKKPAPKKYIPYKEMANYSIAGIGYNLVALLTTYLGLGATNTFVGSIIGIRPTHLQTMNVVMAVIGAVFSIVRGTIVDNTKTRWGKFRPYILFFGFPVIAIDVLFVFLPFNTFSYTQKIFQIMLVSLGHGLLAPFFTDTYGDLKSIMSPNTDERTMLITVQSIIMSLAPTLTNFFVPVFVSLIPGGYTNVTTYRWVIAPVAVVGVFFTLFAAFGCKERTVIAKQYKPKIRLWKGIAEIYKNKYFWVKNFHNWLGFLEGAFGALFGWMFIYYLQDMVMMGVVQTINGIAGGVCMVITPWVLRKMGNRRMLLMVNILNVLFVTLMALTFKLPLIYFIFNWLNTFCGMFYIVGDPVMHAEVKDYQQYLSGQRMDFMFGSAQVIGTAIGIASGYVIPGVYEAMGLTTNYDVLFDPTVRNAMFRVLCYLSIIGSIFNLLPLFFYDLTAIKHRNIIKILKLRALFEDYVTENGVIAPDIIKNNVELVEEAKRYVNLEKPDLKKTRRDAIESLKISATTREERKEKRANIKQALGNITKAKDLYDEIDSAHLVLKELNKFSSREFEEQIVLANATVALGLDGLLAESKDILEKARAIKVTPVKVRLAAESLSVRDRESRAKIAKILSEYNEEKRMRAHQVRRARDILRMQKVAPKLFPDGIIVPDPNKLKIARAMDATTKEDRLIKHKAIKVAEKELDRYHRVAEVLVDAERLIAQKEAYLAYDEIAKGYDIACIAVEEEIKRNEEIEAQKKAEKRAELDRIRQERFEKLSPEKQTIVLEKRAIKEKKQQEKQNRIEALKRDKSDGDDSNNASGSQDNADFNDVENRSENTSKESSEVDVKNNEEK
ncbi:MAG: MFS transporter [Christensenellaceae bacterium]|jgi:Na+/melibiose symporter-like transporter|nr:MFS transporter [Christensenellaceae bacterium]